MKIFMSIPNVAGESISAGYIGKIVLKSADFALGRPTDPVTGLPTGKVLPKGIIITKVVDSSTGFFGNAAASLRLFADPTFIAFTEVMDSRNVEIVRWTFSGTRVVAHQISGHTGGLEPLEQINLTFTQITIKTTSRAADGTTTDRSYTYKPA
jgi:type VI protein secretion system component Hcp